MKKITNIFVLITMLLSFHGAAEAQHDKFIFRKLEGRAVLSRTGGSTWLALQSIQPVDVRPGDFIKVEGDGRGELFYPDGSIVRIKNNAMITVMRSGIQLRLGNAWLKVRRRSDMFKVFTPLGSCSVLGTSFDVNVDRFGKSDVRVFSGIVAVRAAEDERNRQLVLQSGMKTSLSKKDRVSEKPEKFMPSVIEASLISEWENRKLGTTSVPAKASPRQLPPIRQEIDNKPIALPPVDQVLSGVPSPVKAFEKKEKTIIIARQRSAFLENLRKQQLEKDSVIGGRMEDKDRMYKDGHNRELGQHIRPQNLIRNRQDLDREYSNTRNRLLRVQSEMRQTEMEMSSLVAKPVPSSSDKKNISKLQSQLLVSRDEHRALVQRLRELESLKR